MRGLGGWKGKRPSRFNNFKEIDKGCKCVRTLNYKYILTNEKEELYDIRKDPYEEVDISREDPEKAESFRRQLQGALDTSFFGTTEIAHDRHRSEIIKRLQQLGYI